MSDIQDRLTFELWMLLGAAVLALIHIACASFAFKAQVGNNYAVGPRDEDIRPAGLAGRFYRAHRNFNETFPLFLAAVFLVHATGSSGQLSYWGAAAYLVGRTAFLPLYAAGVPWLRSLSWNVATLGLVVTGAQVFWP